MEQIKRAASYVAIDDIIGAVCLAVMFVGLPFVVYALAG
jgi:ABC-type sulfate transport system permease component